jgi:HD-GYP domain-containing protein (c-di-GMP phosphodiesterase class II)
MSEAASIAFREAVSPYLPIHLESLVIDTVLDFDLYMRIGRQLVLYRSRLLPFTEESRQKLIKNNIAQLYVPVTSRGEYQLYIEKNLSTIVADDSIPEETKASIVYDSSTNLVRDVFENPSATENIRRAKDLASNYIQNIMRGREAFVNLMRIASFDYYLYTHSVNVCSYTIALALHLGIHDTKRLWTLGLGAMLHDVGKSRISDRILNKKAPLNKAEFAIVKKHPSWGKEILNETDIIADEAYFPIIQHHERMDGSGYPNGVAGSEIHEYGRIIAICDVFDALTTRRVYQDAMDTFRALKEMFQRKQIFDSKFLEEFTMLMGPSENQPKLWTP